MTSLGMPRQTSWDDGVVNANKGQRGTRHTRGTIFRHELLKEAREHMEPKFRVRSTDTNTKPIHNTLRTLTPAPTASAEWTKYQKDENQPRVRHGASLSYSVPDLGLSVTDLATSSDMTRRPDLSCTRAGRQQREGPSIGMTYKGCPSASHVP
jgi:hypothetical protein